MSANRPTRDTMSLEEATISNMWEITAIAEVLELRASVSPTVDLLPSRLL